MERERGERYMSEKNVKSLFETIARIISDREQVKVTVTVKKKEESVA